MAAAFLLIQATILADIAIAFSLFPIVVLGRRPGEIPGRPTLPASKEHTRRQEMTVPAGRKEQRREFPVLSCGDMAVLQERLPKAAAAEMRTASLTLPSALYLTNPVGSAATA